MRTGPWSACLVSALCAACGIDPLRPAGGGDDASQIEADANNVAAASDGASGDARDAAGAGLDGAASGLDAGPGVADAANVTGDAQGGSSDAGLDAASRPDGQVTPEAGVMACSVEAGVADASCSGTVCSANGGSFVSLHREEGWYVGALDWSAAVCARALGWPSASSADRRDILFALSARDVRELSAGAPLFVGYGNPSTPPNLLTPCSLNTPSPAPVCPATTYPAKHHSLSGCRGPADPNCAVCSTPSGRAGELSYLSSNGADWYTINSAAPPPSCAVSCPSCAGCSYHDEQELKALPLRPECQPCPRDLGEDPCFGLGSCACWCSQSERLIAACPTFAP